MPRKKTKNPPVMSHEFVIQNHADIVSCVAIVLMLGLMFEVTAPLSKVFVFLQYGITEEEDDEDGEKIETFPSEFSRGWMDGFTFFFQALIIIVIHAVVQEYLIDKISKKLHLSKTKTSKFNESGQLSIWSALAAVWAGYCVYLCGIFTNIPSLWEGYPHTVMQWQYKLFMSLQLAYWVHMFPELYLQKVRKEEIPSRVQYYCLYFVFIVVAYAFYFWKFCLVALMLHYSMEFVFHASRMLYFADKNEHAQIGFKIWTILYPIVRFVSLSLTVLVFWIGLRNAPEQGIDVATGNFNSNSIRTMCMTGMCFLQMWLLWQYLQLLSRRNKEHKQAVTQATKKKPVTKSKGAKGKQKKAADSEEESRVNNGKVKKS